MKGLKMKGILCAFAFSEMLHVNVSWTFPTTNVSFVIFSGRDRITVSPNQSPVYVSSINLLPVW